MPNHPARIVRLPYRLCPIFPGRPVVAQWGMADPAQVAGSVDERRRAFHQALVLLARRVDLFLALPVEKLDRLALEARVRGIGAADSRPVEAPTQARE